MLERFFSWPIVCLAWVIGMLVSYTTIGLAGRIATLGNPRYRTGWLLGGAFSTGVGLWSMHFVGMLSFSLPIPLGYDLTITLITLGIAIVISYGSLMLITQPSLATRRLLVGGSCLGLGTAVMHYTGMAALRMWPGIVYAPGMVALSVLISIVGSIAALRIAFGMRDDSTRFWGVRRVGSAIVMGTAIFALHFTGMAAAHFPLGSICRSAMQLDAGWLAITLAGGTLGVLAVTLVLSVLDARLENRTARFASSLQHANEKLMHLATHDTLTQLPNRLLLTERLQHAIASASRRRSQVAIFFLDLDGFKPINDSMGHGAGDAVLKEVAKRLRVALRPEDLIARFGGDEFVAVVEGIRGIDQVVAIAETLFACFHRDFGVSGSKVMLSPSIGISLYPNDAETPELLLRHADAAMYDAKASGRNRYRFFESRMNAATQRNMIIQRALHGAVEHGQLFLEYQPKFTCATRVLSGTEALLRWNHPELGVIAPDEFIHVAERSGQIGVIGQWVLTEVCAQLTRWRDANCPPLKVAINLSPVQLRDPDLVHEILETTRRHGVSPSRLMFEITESVAMRDAESTMQTLQQLHTAGFEMAIDDFGTGYSSLSYLQQFAVRQLKIDRYFVTALEQVGDKGTSIVSSIISLAHAMDMEVVAEGVETESQLETLRRLSCDEVQGFLLARPMSADDLMTIAIEHLVGTGAAAI